MLVSIILPVYNVQDLVNDCIVSIARQTYSDIELIVVDDRGTDHSMDVVRRSVLENGLANRTKFVEHERNRGLSAARNTGLQVASGTYVYFLDSDDEIKPTCIEKMVAMTLRQPVDMVVGDYEVLGSKLPFPELLLGTGYVDSPQKARKLYMKKRIYQMAWNKLVRKDFLVSNNLYFAEGLVHEDCLWSFQCACKLKSLAILKEITYSYKVRECSIMTTLNRNQDFAYYLDVLQQMVGYAKSEKLLQNKYVHSFIEEEKFYFAYTFCRDKNIDAELIRRLESINNELPPGLLFRIFFWNLFKQDSRIRDAHYMLPKKLRLAFFLQMPDIRWQGKGDKHLQHRFNRWYAIMLLKRLCPMLGQVRLLSYKHNE